MTGNGTSSCNLKYHEVTASNAAAVSFCFQSNECLYLFTGLNLKTRAYFNTFIFINMLLFYYKYNIQTHCL